MQCQVCGKSFSNDYNLKRHKKKIHGDDPSLSIYRGTQTSENIRETHDAQTPEGALNATTAPECTPTENMFVFRHPFTCIVSGPTSCGKTYFITRLLQRARDIIQPSPRRIIWLYKRWQPLYDVIRRTVHPKVEFIQGVPWNLERDEFLDTRVRNVIVLNDMATEAAKDSRVTDLFTIGSHN